MTGHIERVLLVSAVLISSSVAYGQPPAREGPPPLPIPPAPPAPERPTEFLAPASDQAGSAAREIAGRAWRFPYFRSQIGGAEWRVLPEAVWRIRPSRECMAALEALGVPARRHEALATPVPTPVQLTGLVNGVNFQTIHPGHPVLISCELATRLPALAEIFRRYGVTAVMVASSHRNSPQTSFHTMGLALDISGFITEWGRFSVAHAYVRTPSEHTCVETPTPSQDPAQMMRHLACELHRSNQLQSVLTPNYNAGHRDHFHIDIRPDDPRLFLR